MANYDKMYSLLFNAITDALEKLETFDEASIKKCFSSLMKETGIKGKAAFEPVRIALTGVTHGPGLYDMIALFGREKTLSRLRDSLKYC